MTLSLKDKETPATVEAYLYDAAPQVASYSVWKIASWVTLKKSMGCLEARYRSGFSDVCSLLLHL